MCLNPICCIPGCESIGIVKTNLNRRGNRSAYLCDFHANYQRSYVFENDVKAGTVKVQPNTISIELETHAYSEKARVEILNDGYVPTSDATVTCEYKSPIYDGMNALVKHVRTFSELMNSGDLVIDSSCGTHVHIGHKTQINATTIDYIRRFYHSLFLPLSRAMEQHPELVSHLFGRNFGTWSEPISEGCNPMEHTNFVNVQHVYSLEWRICKFSGYEQFVQAVKFCRAATNAVIANFVEHFNDADFDTRRYENIREYRKHKAAVAGEKLVKLFYKYSNF